MSAEEQRRAASAATCAHPHTLRSGREGQLEPTAAAMMGAFFNALYWVPGHRVIRASQRFPAL